MDSQKGYKELSTQFYDLSKPVACHDEIKFYANKINQCKGPILEAMCGSGRLLLPLLEMGFDIDGIDNSKAMLLSCQKRAESLNLSVNLIENAIEQIESSKKYGLIYIAVGSFQLIYDLDTALLTLSSLKEILLPGGALVLDMFVPWDILGNDGEPEFTERYIEKKNGDKIVLKSSSIADVKNQILTTTTLYESFENNEVVKTEEEHLEIRWYYPNEMMLFLEKAGFDNISVEYTSFEHNSESIVFQAYHLIPTIG